MLLLYLFLSFLALLFIWVIIDICIALTKKPLPDLPTEKKDRSGLNLIYSFFYNPSAFPKEIKVDEYFIEEALAPTLDYIDARYDCADFSMLFLIRFYLEFKEKLPKKNAQRIKETILSFKYWMDEPGDDSMCYWSENHQLLFAVCEYLAGQEWPDEEFSNSKLSGKDHKAKALDRIEIWLDQRFNYGFSEWYSNNYYPEDIAPMSNFIEFASDRETVNRMKIVFDLLWFDVASHLVNGTFVASSSRMYANNKASDKCGNSLKTEIKVVWEDLDLGELDKLASPHKFSIAGYEFEHSLCGQMEKNFIAMYEKGLYKVPEVIKNIGLDTERNIIKASSGFSPEDLEKEALIGPENRQIMAQLGAETFTNHQVVNNTLKYISSNKMFRNQFVNPFRYFDIKLLRLLKLPEKICERFTLMTHGIALGRGNVYFYRTPNYSLSTAMALDVDSCGAQGHVWTANIAADLCLFTTQASRDDLDPKKHKESPGYWVGNGRQPMSVQEENINISIYKIPKKKRLLEFFISDISHAYMPMNKYDELELYENKAFARCGKVFVALIASKNFSYRPYDPDAALALMPCEPVAQTPEEKERSKFDLVMQGGEYHAYVTELSDSDLESFEDFKKRIIENPLHFKGSKVSYLSQGKQLEVAYDGLFTVNGKDQNLDYKRFDSSYCVAERKAEELVLIHAGRKLILNIKANKRVEV